MSFLAALSVCLGTVLGAVAFTTPGQQLVLVGIGGLMFGGGLALAYVCWQEDL